MKPFYSRQLIPYPWPFFLIYLTATLLFSYDRGFNLPDEGNAVYGAVRILGGETPHRDFLTLYTGGVYYYYALLFSVFGVNLGLIRIATAVTVALIAIVSAHIATRFVKGYWAFLPGAVFVLALPLNPTAYHSWYAVLGGLLSLVAIQRFIEDPRAKWLLIAGMCAGFGFLAKQTMGGFTLAGSLAFLALSERAVARPLIDRLIRTLVLVAIALLFTLYLGQSEFTREHEKILFLAPVWLLPILCLVGLLPVGGGATEKQTVRRPSFFVNSGLLTVGFLAPIGLYFLYFLWNGAAGDLVTGVLKRPSLFVDEWTSGNQYPRLLSWVMNPLGTFLFLLILPCWALARRVRWAKYGIFPLILIGVGVYLYRFLTEAIARTDSLFGFLSWANYELFFSVVFFVPPFAAWLALAALGVGRVLRSGNRFTTELAPHLVAVSVAHVFAFFCIYPMQHPFYLVYLLPTTLILLTVVAHQIWLLDPVTDWRSANWVTRLSGTGRLALVLSLPAVAAAAFLVWGTQYWIGLRDVGATGALRWDNRVAFTLPRGSWGVAVKPEEAEAISSVSAYLRQNTTTEDRVFALASTSPLVLFLAERLSPSKIDFPVATDTEVDDTVRSMESKPPKLLALAWPWDEKPSVAAFLLSRYARDVQIGEYTIYRRRD